VAGALSLAAVSLLSACSGRELTAPATPLPSQADPSPLLLTPVGSSLFLHLGIVAPSAALTGVRVSWGSTAWELRGSGPWSTALPTPAQAVAELRVTPIPGSAPFTPLTVPLFEWRDTWDLVLLPRHPMPDCVYREGLDLLVEFLKPFDGGFVRRWTVEQLRVAEPSYRGEVDYLGTLRAAVAIWNRCLQTERFVLVPPGSSCEIACEIFDEASLGYTQLLQRDDEHRPLKMKIHLSPRWAVGAEKYVQRAWVHELGHTLGLWGHSRDPRHVLHGLFIAVDEPDPEEVRMARWLWSIPSGTHLGWFERPALETTSRGGIRPRAASTDTGMEGLPRTGSGAGGACSKGITTGGAPGSSPTAIGRASGTAGCRLLPPSSPAADATHRR